MGSGYGTGREGRGGEDRGGQGRTGEERVRNSVEGCQEGGWWWRMMMGAELDILSGMLGNRIFSFFLWTLGGGGVDSHTLMQMLSIELNGTLPPYFPDQLCLSFRAGSVYIFLC